MKKPVNRTSCNAGDMVQTSGAKNFMNGRIWTSMVRGVALIGVVLALGWACPIQAKDGEDDDDPPKQEDHDDDSDDSPKLKRHGTVIGLSDDSKSGKGSGKSPRPELLPSDVKVLIEKFKADREKFLKEQQELERQLKQDSKANRDTLRNQLKSSLDKWKEQQKEFRDRLKDRMKEIEQSEIEDVVRSGKGGKGSGKGSGGRDRNDK